VCLHWFGNVQTISLLLLSQREEEITVWKLFFSSYLCLEPKITIYFYFFRQVSFGGKMIHIHHSVHV
jgi:hypothetical protein